MALLDLKVKNLGSVRDKLARLSGPQIRGCLIRRLIRLTAARGTAWLAGYVAGWSMWADLRGDFWRQWRTVSENKESQ